MSQNNELETSPCVSLEMLPLNAGELIENHRNLKSNKAVTKLSSFMTHANSSTDVEALFMGLEKNKVNTGAVSAFDILSSNVKTLDDELENNLHSSLNLFSAPSTLSLNEETFINEIKKLVQNKECNRSAVKPVNGCLLNGMDVIFGTAKLVQSTIEARAPRIVPLNPRVIVNEQSELSVEDESKKDDVKFSESPRVSFILPKDKTRKVVIPVSETVLPPNWSPCSRYTGRHLKRNIAPTPRTPYNSLTPSECSHISSESSSAARECFKIMCIMILGSVEVGLLLSIINFVALDTISGALGLVGLCSLFVITLLCGLIVVKNGGSRCAGEMSCIV